MKTLARTTAAVAFAAMTLVTACGGGSRTSDSVNGSTATTDTTGGAYQTTAAPAAVDTIHHSKLAGAAVGAVAGGVLGGKKGALLGAAAGAYVQHHRNKVAQQKAAAHTP